MPSYQATSSLTNMQAKLFTGCYIYHGLLQDPSLPSPSIFGRHAEKWFPAVAGAITADMEDPSKEGLHYLLLDVCTMFLGWPSIFPVDRRGSIARELQPVASGFLSFLVGHC